METIRCERENVGYEIFGKKYLKIIMFIFFFWIFFPGFQPAKCFRLTTILFFYFFFTFFTTFSFIINERLIVFTSYQIDFNISIYFIFIYTILHFAKINKNLIKIRRIFNDSRHWNVCLIKILLKWL